MKDKDKDYEVGTQEYLVKNAKKVSAFIDSEIGVEFEVGGDDDIVVFDLFASEHKKIRDFITINKLWKED
jgi:hypothetical protein